MPWSQSQKNMSKRRGCTAAPAAAAAGVSGGGDGGEVAVQKVHNLAPKPSFHHDGHGKLRKIDSIKEDINRKAARFIQRTKAKFNQSKSFRQPLAAGPPAPATGRGDQFI